MESAQQRLAQAALKQPMHPGGAAISAYLNGMLQSARIDALIEVMVDLPNGNQMQEAIDAAIVRHLNKKADELENQALKMTLAQSVTDASRIQLPS